MSWSHLISCAITALKISKRPDTNNYVSGDYETMEEQMKGVNWEEELYGKDVNGIWEVICDKITDVVDRNVPKMKTNMFNTLTASCFWG